MNHIEPGMYIALARVDSGEDGADAVSTITLEDGTIAGFNVEVMVMQGIYVNTRIVAVLTCPVGQEIPNYPQPGTMLVIAFTEGRPDLGAFVIAQVPGGLARPIPKAAAGIKISDEGLSKTQVRQPPKGVGVREYVRGAPFVIRLKGTEDGFAGEFYIEADDTDDDPEKKNGTFIRVAKHPNTGKFVIKLRDASGASVTVTDGGIILRSPNQENSVEISDQAITISGNVVAIQAKTLLKIDAPVIAENIPAAAYAGLAPGSPLAAIRGTTGATGTPSLAHYVGLLCQASTSRSRPRAAPSLSK